MRPSVRPFRKFHWFLGIKASMLWRPLDSKAAMTPLWVFDKRCCPPAWLETRHRYHDSPVNISRTMFSFLKKSGSPASPRRNSREEKRNSRGSSSPMSSSPRPRFRLRLASSGAFWVLIGRPITPSQPLACLQTTGTRPAPRWREAMQLHLHRQQGLHPDAHMFLMCQITDDPKRRKPTLSIRQRATCTLASS